MVTRPTCRAGDETGQAARGRGGRRLPGRGARVRGSGHADLDVRVRCRHQRPVLLADAGLARLLGRPTGPRAATPPARRASQGLDRPRRPPSPPCSLCLAGAPAAARGDPALHRRILGPQHGLPSLDRAADVDSAGDGEGGPRTQGQEGNPSWDRPDVLPGQGEAHSPRALARHRAAEDASGSPPAAAWRRADGHAACQSHRLAAPLRGHAQGRQGSGSQARPLQGAGGQGQGLWEHPHPHPHPRPGEGGSWGGRAAVPVRWGFPD